MVIPYQTESANILAMVILGSTTNLIPTNISGYTVNLLNLQTTNFTNDRILYTVIIMYNYMHCIKLILKEIKG